MRPASGPGAARIGAGARYVSLGSSFAAGPGIRPLAVNAPRKAGRSAVNYAQIVAGGLGLSLRDASYSGATTADVLEPNADGAPAQLDAVTADAALVTILIGGNDIGYIGALMAASMPKALRVLLRRSAPLEEALDASTLDSRFAALEKTLTIIVQRAAMQAPDARIVLVDYLTILPLDGTPEKLSADVVEWGRVVASRLSDTYRSVADRTVAEVLPVAEASLEHDAWSSEPWVSAFTFSPRGAAPYHPTLDGMRAVADMLVERLRPA